LIKVNLLFAYGKIQMVADTQQSQTQLVPLDKFSGRLIPSGTLVNGKLLQHQNLVRHTKEKESFLLPTPTAMSKSENVHYSRPGQDKLEMRLRELGIIPKGEISTANLREWMMGVPQDYTKLVDQDGGKLTPLREKYQP
jgi:hypothetical protein